MKEWLTCSKIKESLYKGDVQVVEHSYKYGIAFVKVIVSHILSSVLIDTVKHITTTCYFPQGIIFFIQAWNFLNL